LRKDYPVRALTDATIRIRLPGLPGGGRGQVSEGGQTADQENEVGQSSVATAALHGGSAKRKVIDLEDKEKRRAREATRENIESAKAKAKLRKTTAAYKQNAREKAKERRATVAAKAKAKERKTQPHTSKRNKNGMPSEEPQWQPRRKQKSEEPQLQPRRKQKREKSHPHTSKRKNRIKTGNTRWHKSSKLNSGRKHGRKISANRTSQAT
jgi:hypothetical protein